MTANDLAQIIAKAQEQGAPEWGVTVIVQQHQLSEAFTRHCNEDDVRWRQHCEQDSARRAPWKAAGQRVFELLVTAGVVWLLMQAPAILGVAR